MKPHRLAVVLVLLSSSLAAAAVPGGSTSAHRSGAVQTKRAAATPAPAAFVTVRRGETLFHIARAHHLSVQQLRALNGLKTSTIRVGQRLRIVAGVAAQPSHKAVSRTIIKPSIKSKRGQQTHKVPSPPKLLRVVWTFVSVRPGDTLRTLAARYQVSPLRLMQVNHFWGQRLSAGQRLLVPRRSEVVGPPAPGQLGPAVRVSALRVMGVPLTAARVDLSRPGVRVAPVLPLGGVGKVGARVGTLAKLSGAELVVNGGFFHPLTYALAGDLVSGGRLLALGSSPVALAVTSDNHARILDVLPGSSWVGFETVVSGGPHLLMGGLLGKNLHRGLTDPGIFGRRTRTMLGLRSSTELLLVVTRTPVTVTEAAKLLRALGARDGMLLDGGSSSGMAYKGRELLASGRKVAFGLGIQTNYVGLRFRR